MKTEGSYKLLSNDKNIEEEPISLETAADLRPQCMQFAEQFENEYEDDKEDVPIDRRLEDERRLEGLIGLEGLDWKDRMSGKCVWWECLKCLK
ncbi:hypothetical protein QVD17_19234 [Tagetes erecta]|uniref:Uncharacterized protein n=1 Tax=Tagetes erecta TaxID=13708 RepID=A0AAD8KLY7_TARER|nr:hypothetical protein QVD17_19234 [Tagetes erecta]